jgi:hypothetical protein
MCVEKRRKGEKEKENSQMNYEYKETALWHTASKLTSSNYEDYKETLIL